MNITQQMAQRIMDALKEEKGIFVRDMQIADHSNIKMELDRDPDDILLNHDNVFVVNFSDKENAGLEASRQCLICFDDGFDEYEMIKEALSCVPDLREIRKEAEYTAMDQVELYQKYFENATDQEKVQLQMAQMQATMGLIDLKEFKERLLEINSDFKIFE